MSPDIWVLVAAVILGLSFMGLAAFTIHRLGVHAPKSLLALATLFGALPAVLYALWR